MAIAQLAQRVRTADDFVAIADAVITELRALPGVTAVALTANDSEGPAAWIGSDDFDRERVRGYLDRGYLDDPSLPYVRAGPAVRLDELVADAPRLLADWGHAVSDATLWIAPIVGDELLGTLRVAGDPGELAVASTLVSVRLATLGIRAPLAAHARPATLTPRQREVAWLVARGCTNHEIAGMLGVSANAVKKHVSRVLVLLDVSNRTELAAISGRWSGPDTPCDTSARSVTIVAARWPGR